MKPFESFTAFKYKLFNSYPIDFDLIYFPFKRKVI